MSFINQSVLYARKLSVFFLFLAVFAIFFCVYFFKYIPANREEFTNRGFRILNQFSQNIIQKNAEVEKTFSDVDIIELKDSASQSQKKSFSLLYNTLYSNLPFIILDTAKAVKSGIGKGHDTNNNFIALIDNKWSFHYPAKNTYGTGIVTNKFLDPILKTRNDLFENYLLLWDQDHAYVKKNNPAENNKNELAIIYQQSNITSSVQLNIDTLLKVQRNTDFSNTINLDIGGKNYKIFFSPFNLNGQSFVLAGLIPKEKYENKIKSTPTGFIPVITIIILLLLISLPFIKIFLLSSKEPIGRIDLLFTSLSIFFGSALIVLIIFYLLFEYTSHQTFNNRLKDIRGQIKKDIENEFDLADKQLVKCNAIYSNCLDDERKKALVYKQPDDRIVKSVDALFAPLTCKNMTRVFWIDSAGATLAKWNPFDFEAPLSNVNDYTFFKMLNKETPLSYKSGRGDFKIIYPGKSNTTGEFQLYIVRPDSIAILTTDTGKGKPPFINRKSIAVVMALSPNCSDYPILPPGFGFCLIDSTGEVLIHSDKSKNLSENIFSETVENDRLQNCINYKNETIINNVSLYGEQHVFGITPIKDQPLSLVIFYNKSLLYNNTLRLLHFAVQSLLYTYLALLACIFFSTGVSYKPSKLKFSIKKIEWVRPAGENANSYQFTRRYFILLTGLTTMLFLFILLFNYDLRAIFYISLVLPLYTIWGFIGSRKRNDYLKKNKEGTQGILKKIGAAYFISLVKTSYITFLFIALFNISLVCLYKKFPGSEESLFFVLLFQFVTIAFLLHSYRKTDERKTNNSGNAPAQVIHSHTFIIRNYFHSLYLAMLLIGVLPAAGIVIYGYQAEKIQFKKNKQLSIASAFETRQNFVFNTLIPDYKPVVLRSLKKQNYFDDVKFRAGIYLTDRDSVFSGPKQMPHPTGSFQLCDEPYASMMDNIYLINPVKFKNYSVNTAGQDSSWFFRGENNPFGKDRYRGQYLMLAYRNRYIDSSLSSKRVQVMSAINNPLKNFWNLNILLQGFIVLCLTILAFVSHRLIRSAMNRLFLLQYTYSGNKIVVNHEYLDKYFRNMNAQKPYLKDIVVPEIVTSSFFRTEAQHPISDHPDSREDYVVAMTKYFNKPFQNIWTDLPAPEQYFVFDFAVDGYTNYKDADTLYLLINKGIIVHEKDTLELFSLSFRNFLLSKKGSQEILKLKDENALPGFWETFRIPVFVFISVTAIFLFITQQDFSHQLTAILTSIAALIPLILKLFEKLSSPKAENKT